MKALLTRQPGRLGPCLCVSLLALALAPALSRAAAGLSPEEQARLARSLVISEQSWTNPTIAGRSVPLFASVLIIEKDGILYRSLDPDAIIQPPFPNRWIFEHGLNLLDSSLATRDPDRDGFSNLEEFENDTDPKDPEDRPSPLLKLEYLGLHEEAFPYRYSARLDENTVQVDRILRDRRRSQPSLLQVGGTTKDGSLRLDGIGPNSIRSTFLRTGETLEIPKGSTVVAALRFARLRDPLPGGKVFLVEEGERFSLPSSPSKAFELRRVTERSATVAAEGGEGHTIPLDREAR